MGQREVKEANTKKGGDEEELLAELKLQGLSEDQARGRDLTPWGSVSLLFDTV